MNAIREIVSIVSEATEYHGRSHIMLPIEWDGRYVVAVLNNNREGVKIAHVVTKFGNSCHLILPKFWKGQTIYCKVGGRIEEKDNDDVNRVILLA